MWLELEDLDPQRTELRAMPARRLLGGGALVMLLAGSLAFATPTFAQDDTTAEPTVAASESTGATVETGADTAATGTDAAATDAAAPADTAAAPADTAAAPAAPAAGSGTTATALPNTGVGATTGPLALIGLAAAGAVAAGAVAINQARPAVRRTEWRA